jgi:hypothetical protein
MDSDLVFPSSMGQGGRGKGGTPLRRQNVSRYWLHPLQDACVHCGRQPADEKGQPAKHCTCPKYAPRLPHISFHELRHTGASIVAELFPKELIALRDRLGHESVETTADVYVHLDLAAQKRISDRLDATFSERLREA